MTGKDMAADDYFKQLFLQYRLSCLDSSHTYFVQGNPSFFISTASCRM
jgi:hypothetical protein